MRLLEAQSYNTLVVGVRMHGNQYGHTYHPFAYFVPPLFSDNHSEKRGCQKRVLQEYKQLDLDS